MGGLKDGLFDKETVGTPGQLPDGVKVQRGGVGDKDGVIAFRHGRRGKLGVQQCLRLRRQRALVVAQGVRLQGQAPLGGQRRQVLQMAGADAAQADKEDFHIFHTPISFIRSMQRWSWA